MSEKWWDMLWQTVEGQRERALCSGATLWTGWVCLNIWKGETEPGANSFICSALSHRHLLVKAGNAADVTTLVCSRRNPEWWLYIRFSTSPTIIYKHLTYYRSGQVSQNIVCRLWQAPFAYCNKTSHHLLTLMSFQTCMILFLLRSRK